MNACDPQQPEYLPVPVEAAVDVAMRYGKDIVIITCVDISNDRMHVTTFGRLSSHKTYAAELGDRVGQVISECNQQERYEDFRYVDQAKRAEQIRALRDLAADFVASYEIRPMGDLYTRALSLLSETEV